MSENNEETKLPSQIIFENLKEFLRAKNAAPQPSWHLFVEVFLETSLRHSLYYHECWRMRSAPLHSLDHIYSKYYKGEVTHEVPYLEALDQSCKGLADIAQWKQDMLYKKIHHEAKVIRDSRDYNTLLKAYEKEQADLVRAGAFVQVGWMEIAGKA